MLLNVEKLGFENLEEIEFLPGPKCEECNSDEEGMLVVEQGEDIGHAMASLLSVFDCPACAGLVLGAGKLHKLFLPSHFVVDEYSYEDGMTFTGILCDTNKGGSKEEFIDMFVKFVNDADIHHLVILQEEPTDKGCYNFITRESSNKANNN